MYNKIYHTFASYLILSCFRQCSTRKSYDQRFNAHFHTSKPIHRNTFSLRENYPRAIREIHREKRTPVTPTPLAINHASAVPDENGRPAPP